MWNVGEVLIRVLNFIQMVLALALGLRIVLKLLSANSATPVVSWAYELTNPLVFPFAGIFPSLNLAGGVLDIVAVIALAAYSVLIYLVIALVEPIAQGTVAHKQIDRAVHAHDVRTKPTLKAEDVDYEDL